MKFSELGLMPLITESMGYQEPTPIQTQAIPPALAGRDVLGCAQTGTGKTCAFATPILQRLAQSPNRGERVIRALILTPTRELALQIQENFEAYGKGLPLRSAVIFGGVGQKPQVDKIKKGLDILVATPGRLLDLHGQGLLDLSHVEIFVLDEADRMLDMGFIHDVRRVLKVLPEKKQTLFFSATMPPEVMELVDALLHDPAKVAVDPISSPVEVIDQCVYFVDKGNKTKLLAQLVEELQVPSALVFSRTKHGANKVAQDLNKAGLTAAAIHGKPHHLIGVKWGGDHTGVRLLLQQLLIHLRLADNDAADIHPDGPADHIQLLAADDNAVRMGKHQVLPVRGQGDGHCTGDGVLDLTAAVEHMALQHGQQIVHRNVLDHRVPD